MARNYKDWLTAFVQYASYTEAPALMHFFAGVSAVAGALRRKVWFDQVFFRWYPSFYIVFVAPPGIVAKSTTADVAMELLREVPGIKFGPDSVTWQSLVKTFSEANEAFDYNGAWHPMSPINLVASEFKNLIDFNNREMINLFITLWDGRQRYEKETKMSGDDVVEAPWINVIACTTPHWIADNMSQITIGGGFTSRCIFIYADKKEKYAAYLEDSVPTDIQQTRIKLVQDLEHISLNLVGPYKLSKDGKKWGQEWYEHLWKSEYNEASEDWKNGYIARKQTHLHKLAMVLAASAGDKMTIEKDHLQLANIMLEETEQNAAKVFSKIGLTEDASQTLRLMEYIRRRGEVPYEEAYQIVHARFPDFREYEGIVAGLIRSGYITLVQKGEKLYLKAASVN